MGTFSDHASLNFTPLSKVSFNLILYLSELADSDVCVKRGDFNLVCSNLLFAN